MKTLSTYLTSLLLIQTIVACSQKNDSITYNKTPYVNYGFFEKLVEEVKPYRAEKLVKFDKFLEMAKEDNTIILDTRSKEMYEKLHIDGAINLPFADFTQATLAKVIPSKETRVLIYCNNNFAQDNDIFVRAFMSKAYRPDLQENLPFYPKREQSLALNIPTYINLYGYGYKNVYELDELVYNANPKLKLTGTDSQNKLITNKTDSYAMNNDSLRQPLVSYEFFEEKVKEAKPIRAERLISFAKFNEFAKEKDVIIIDARSKEMYDKLHIQGAKHLEFSDFTQESLRRLVPNTDTKILIYCNNNFSQRTPIFREDFASKAIIPSKTDLGSLEQTSSTLLTEITNNSLALNIPTYINLHGYGYTNIYELNELVFSDNITLSLEGTDAGKLK